MSESSNTLLLLPSAPPPFLRTSSSGLSQTEGVAHTADVSNGRGVVLRQRAGLGRRERHTHNGIVFTRPKSEYISPAGISALDIRTRLRITEAELAIVQRELSDLLAERSLLEASSRQYEESWRFSVSEFGRVVEQKDELQKKYEALEQAVTMASQSTPELKGKKSSKVTKATIEQLRLSLETQTRVAEVYEQERDRAYDDYEMAQVQLHTLFQQYQDLASSCSEVARERDRQKAEVHLMRDELHRYDPDSDLSSSRNSLKKPDSTTGSRVSLTSVGGASSMGGTSSCMGDSDENQCTTDSQVLSQQIREAREERERISAKYDQLMKKADQFQKQLYRAEEDRRQALATSEALTSLWQKKFDKAQNENYDLRQEVLSAHERISLLQDHLAMARLQSRGNTPLRPSPPDGNTPIGHQSPVKAPSTTIGGPGADGGGFWGSKLNSSGGSIGSSKESSLISSGGSGMGLAGGGVPQRTSSFHGFNQVTHYSSSQTTSGHSSSQKQSANGVVPISRSGSLKSPKELISPFSSSFTYGPRPAAPHIKYLQGEQRHSTDDEGSWI